MKDVPKVDADTICNHLTPHNIFFITKNGQPGEEHLFMSLIKEADVLLQLFVNAAGLHSAAKSENPNYAKAAFYGVMALLTQ